MESSLLPLIMFLLFVLSIIAIPIILVLLVLLASRGNWNSEPSKEKVVSFVGFWKRISIWIVNAIISILIVPLFLNIYFYLRDGQTIADKLYGTKIVDKKTMKTASVGKLIMRCVAKFFSTLCIGIGFFAAGVRSEKRAWHDEWADIRYISYKKVSWVWTFLPIFLVFVLPTLVDLIRAFLA